VLVRKGVVMMTDDDDDVVGDNTGILRAAMTS
jgi:hypothetical protein